MLIPCDIEPGRFYAHLSPENLQDLPNVEIRIPPFSADTWTMGKTGWQGRIAHSTPISFPTRPLLRFYKDDINNGISLKLPSRLRQSKVLDYWESLQEVAPMIGTKGFKKRSFRWSLSHTEYINEVVDYLKSLGPRKRFNVLNASGMFDGYDVSKAINYKTFDSRVTIAPKIIVTEPKIEDQVRHESLINTNKQLLSQLRDANQSYDNLLTKYDTLRYNLTKEKSEETTLDVLNKVCVRLRADLGEDWVPSIPVKYEAELFDFPGLDLKLVVEDGEVKEDAA